MAYIGNGPGVSSQRIVSEFEPTTNTTSFTPSSGYSVGYVDVYLNGIKLQNGTDFTATNGTNVVLTDAAVSGDLVEIVAYIPRGLSDGYTKTEADARYMDINEETLPDQSGHNGQFLQTDGTNADWATVNTDLVSDTSPQLGGDLASNGNDINFGDNDKAQFGASNDLQIYHDGTHSKIVDTGTGNLFLQASSAFKLSNADATKTSIYALTEGGVQLKYDNSTKLETTSTGVDVTGSANISDTAPVLKVTTTNGGTAELNLHRVADNDVYTDWKVRNEGGAFYLRKDNASNDDYAMIRGDAGIELYYNNNKKLETVSDGVEINGNIRRSANADFRFKEMPQVGASSSGWHTITDLGLISSGVWEITVCPRLRFGSNQGFIGGALFTTSNSQITEVRMLEERFTVNGFGNLSPTVTWIVDLGTDQTYTYDIRFRLYYQSNDSYGMNYNDGNGRPYFMARKIRETTSTGVSEIRTY